MNMLKTWLGLLLVSLLAACGGGGGSGTPLNGGGSSSSGSASDLVLVLSAASISNSGQETVTATVTAVDSNRNAVASVPVTVSVDNNALVRVAGTSTDAEGKLAATIEIGSDRTQRTITVTATSGSMKKTASLQVTNRAVNSQPTLDLLLSSATISSASPATVTATLRDVSSQPIAGQVVTFKVVRSLGVTNVGTALTDSQGRAVALLSPASPTASGADELQASTSVTGIEVLATRGFQVQATNVTIEGFASSVPSLSAYGQTSMTVTLSGVSIGSPVQVGVTSACVALGKATLSPSTFTTTSASVTLQFKDNGCGAVQAADQLQATIVGSTQVRSLSLPIAAPSVSSLAFIRAEPEVIFLKGSGFAEAATVTFEVRDAAGNALPNRDVVAKLLTLTGGVTMEGGTADVVRTSDALGRISVRVNSGTLPTPVRVAATLQGTTVSTVSSNLSVAVGLPSQLNFSLSQGTKNIEGYNIDGTPNTYQIIAADRNGNPIPAGTSVNFVAEGGQVEAIKQTAIVSGIARTTANFVSSEPRPVDGRVTVVAYALGEESFIDLNGNNTKDAGEPFQDLGNIFKDRLFNGRYDATTDEFIPLAINNTSGCVDSGNPLLAFDPSIPSVSGTCDGAWSGAGQVFVRRATETVLSTSSARPLWADVRGLTASCSKISLQVGPEVTSLAQFTQVAGDTWYGGASDGLSFIVADANPGRVNPATGDFDPPAGYPRPRLNPMAAGTVITATTPTNGLTVSIGGGSPVASSLEATGGAIAYSFSETASSGVIFVTFRSPSGLGTTFGINVVKGSKPAGAGDCG